MTDFERELQFNKIVENEKHTVFVQTSNCAINATTAMFCSVSHPGSIHEHHHNVQSPTHSSKCNAFIPL